ncbi:peptidoglycan DD-metalloendopeptidase family protein [Emcibacteraceae bacterium]|nr:peptidoglycan DD-metalloendopeptidase family protein [Emcibacteraceae bacterium]
MKIINFFKNLDDILDHYFPDRQMYFRTNGDVRFIKVSKNVQIFLCTGLLCFFVWCLFISYNYVYLDEILTEKNDEVEQAKENYLKIEQQYAELQNEIQKSAAALEQRQKYIQQVLEENGEVMSPVLPLNDNDDFTAPEYVDVDENDNDQEARNVIRDEKLEKLYVDLKRVEMQQNQLVKNMNDEVDQKLSFLSDTLTKAGITPEKMMELANLPLEPSASGGPFIAVSNISEANLDTHAFDSLFYKRAHLENIKTALDHLPIITPPEKHYVSSKFGMRRDPFTRKWATHNGLDMAGWRNTPINSGGAGIVTRAGRNGAFGLFVEINHGNGFKTKYGHLSKVKVERGEKVEANQLIGLMGSTGRSTSTHLHYEIWFNGKPIDPLKVLKAAKDVQKIKQQKHDA